MPEPAKAAEPPSPALLWLIAVATGTLVANLYYAQPLLAWIGPDIGISPDLAGSVVSMTQIGYGCGLFFLVSLADLVENRRLVLITMTLTVLGVGGVALSTSAAPFFAASFAVGVCATGAQVLVPFVARLVPEENRGRAIGNVMAGLLTGIMLSRPVSLFVAASFGWRTVFFASGVLILAIAAALSRALPRYQPASGMSYRAILASMPRLLRDLPALRWRAAYQALMFAAFSLFWTAAPLLLAERFGMSEHGIGLFALAGAGGALAAPVAGRLADRGLSVATTAAAMLMLTVAFFLTPFVVDARALIAFAVLAIVIDAAVQLNQITGQRIIFAVPGEIRGRVNALYITIAFAGGAVGSLLGTVTYHRGGWTAAAVAGGCIGLALLGLFAIERTRSR